jgi:hypothetical protein
MPPGIAGFGTTTVTVAADSLAQALLQADSPALAGFSVARKPIACGKQ